MTQRSRLNVFGQPAADRRGIERASDEWVLAQRDLPEARFIVLSGMRCLVDDTAAVVKLAAGSLPSQWRDWQRVFLGCIRDTPFFALAAPPETEDHFSGYGSFAELRGIAMQLQSADAALIVHARAVLHWHSINRYCGGCGRQLLVSAAGHARRCAHDDCEVQEFYPRIDPAVIVLVTHETRCLLGRQATWPENRYSCLAGFMEAGETLEETVRREVHEEAGVSVDAIEYHSSQPWPFPQSLMVGFRAAARSRDIVLHDDELEDARWFSRADIRAGLEDGSLKLSSPLSIAYRLLRDWYAERDDARLLDEYAGTV